MGRSWAIKTPESLRTRPARPTVPDAGDTPRKTNVRAASRLPMSIPAQGVARHTQQFTLEEQLLFLRSLGK